MKFDGSLADKTLCLLWFFCRLLLECVDFLKILVITTILVSVVSLLTVCLSLDPYTCTFREFILIIQSKKIIYATMKFGLFFSISFWLLSWWKKWWIK